MRTAFVFCGMLLVTAMLATASAQSTQQTSPQSGTQGQASGDKWRFVYHRGHWWYWMPNETWKVWRDGQWHDESQVAKRSTGTFSTQRFPSDLLRDRTLIYGRLPLPQETLPQVSPYNNFSNPAPYVPYYPYQVGSGGRLYPNVGPPSNYGRPYGIYQSQGTLPGEGVNYSGYLPWRGPQFPRW